MGPLPKPKQLSYKLLNLLGIILTCGLLACGGGSVGGGLGGGVGGGAGAGGALDGSGPGGGGTQNTPLDHDAVGPMTDYSYIINFLSCQPIKCIPNYGVDAEGLYTNEPSEDGCTYTLVFTIQAFVIDDDGLSPPASNRVMRVVEQGLKKYKDYVLDGEGKTTIELPTDTSPWVDFWLHPSDKNPAEVNAAALFQDYTSLDEIISPDFYYLKRGPVSSCDFLKPKGIDSSKIKFSPGLNL